MALILQGIRTEGSWQGAGGALQPEAARSAERANPRFFLLILFILRACGQFFFLSDGSHSISAISAVASASRIARYAIHCHFSDSTSPSGLT